MTAERPPTSTPGSTSTPGPTSAGVPAQDEEDALLDVAYEGDEYGDEEIDDLEEEEERAAEERRGWPLGGLLLFAIGIWVGRWVSQLPVNAQETVGLLLVIATAVLGAALYRRWVRRQMAQARARRVRR
ncbi:MAG: hypothetical protein IT299_05100 [Dehalococcoidia bacterium]|nr:hypothetical protein [Dehalococcoidia bacterium]